jgi:hypothetical protein
VETGGVLVRLGEREQRCLAERPRVASIRLDLTIFAFGFQRGARRDPRRWFSVVGVVRDVKQSSLDAGPQDSIYVPAGQWHRVDPSMTVVLRTPSNPATNDGNVL